MSAADTNYDILSGDWWLIRQCPLRTGLVLRPRRKPGHVQAGTRQLTMGELSEMAAKLCFRLHSIDLQGGTVLLTELQRDRRQLAEYTARTREINRRLDLGGKRVEKLKQSRDVHRFTVDHIYKLAVLQGVTDPAPCVLEWGAVLTWLLQHVGSQPADTGGSIGIPGGTVPLECVVYAACAMCLITPIGSDSTDRLSADISDESSAGQLQRRVTDVCEEYLGRPRVLVSPADFNRLRRLVDHERGELFEMAQRYSAGLRLLLNRLGVQS
ncbi:MAG: hypothetical protein ACKO3T_20095 [Planctomycetaceae bacterium]